jgi:protein pelota
LRVRGKNITENDHVKIGQFHTLELELKRPFVLRKVRTNFLPVNYGITILVSVDDKYPLA